MKTTKRFDTAVTKLYNAFNEGTLNADDCKHCAVGNMCDNKGGWHMGNSLSTISETISNFFDTPKHPHYNINELFNIEKIFLEEHIKLFLDKGSMERTTFKNSYIMIDSPSKLVGDKEAQFNGLMSVIDYLAELDNIKVPQITVEQFKTVLTEA